MLRPVDEVRRVASEAARAQAEKDAAKAERFVRDVVATDIDAAASLGRSFVVIASEALPCHAACEVAVRILTEAGYTAKYAPPTRLDFGMSLGAVQTHAGALTIWWSK